MTPDFNEFHVKNFRKTSAFGGARTLDLEIMRLTLCQLSYEDILMWIERGNLYQYPFGPIFKKSLVGVAWLASTVVRRSPVAGSNDELRVIPWRRGAPRWDRVHL